MEIAEILSALNSEQVRATYGAVGELLGVNLQMIRIDTTIPTVRKRSVAYDRPGRRRLA